jgi:hypothetical protein
MRSSTALLSGLSLWLGGGLAAGLPCGCGHLDALTADSAAPLDDGGGGSTGDPIGEEPPPRAPALPPPWGDGSNVEIPPDDTARTPADLDAGSVEGSAEIDAPAEAQADRPEPDGDPPVAAPPLPPFDAGEGGVCTAPLGPGDLWIDELMIESVAGSGDHGEWLEVASTLGCALDLRGLRGDAPSGTRVRSFSVGDDLWIPALGTLVVADSSNGTINHALPGTLVPWSGQPGDVLRNMGDTITLRMNGVVIDSLTYPAMTLSAGTSIAFPADCAPPRRTDWTLWQLSTASWFPGFQGTPNAANADVHCP